MNQRRGRGERLWAVLLVGFLGAAGVSCSESVELEVSSRELDDPGHRTCLKVPPYICTSTVETKPSTCPEMSDNDVCVCRDADFQGPCKVLTWSRRFYPAIGDLLEVGDTGPFGQFNNSISSIFTGKNVRPVISRKVGGECNGTNNQYPLGSGWTENTVMYAPACVLLDSGARYPALHNSLLEMHEGPCEYADNGRVECMQDIISAVSLQKLNEYDFSHLGQYDDCVPGPGQVAIFRNEFLRSAAGGKNDEVYMPTCMVLDEGDYPNPFWNSSNGHSGGGFGLPNDTVDSFNANGVEVELFEDVNFNLDNPAARRLGFGPGIVNDLGVYDFHDKVSGIRVHRKIFADGLYRADNNPIVYSQKRGRRVCQMTGPQWAALNYPSVSFRTATEISNAGFVGASVCTNGEVGLGPYSPPGIYKADNDPTIYALNGARACRLTWGQYVAIHQPAFTTLTGVGISVFKDSYDSGQLCTDQEFGYVGLPHWKRL